MAARYMDLSEETVQLNGRKPACIFAGTASCPASDARVRTKYCSAECAREGKARWMRNGQKEHAEERRASKNRDKKKAQPKRAAARHTANRLSRKKLELEQLRHGKQ